MLGIGKPIEFFREHFTKTWVKVKEVILTVTYCRSKIIFQGGNVLSDIIVKTNSLHICNSKKMEIFIEASDLQYSRQGVHYQYLS